MTPTIDRVAVFRRNERDGGETAILTVRVTNVATDAIPSLKIALTRWMLRTPEGREAWKDSHEDFNIGDLDSYLKAPTLKPFLEEVCIAEVAITYLGRGDFYPYDEILANSSLLEEAGEKIDG